ncbi:MAG: DNA repair protein RecO, partial [Anaeroplasmataceae bacterium]|nr:DNA repair protein RecO [Anaeroplasmataceae bacterium]
MEGIVIKSIEYKEKSKLVYLYTPFGMKSVKALDVQKTKLGFVTTLNQVEFQISQGKLPTVLEYTLKKSFYSMYQNMDKIGVLAPILDVISHLEEDANHTRIYPFFLEALTELENTEHPLFVLSIFLIKMLSVFGIKPELKSCVLCSRTSIVNFSISNGGALCDHCSTSNENNLAIYEAFKAFYYNKGFEFKEIKISYPTLLEAIYSYYLLHANLKLKSYKL